MLVSRKESETRSSRGEFTSENGGTKMDYQFETLIDSGEAARLLRVHPKTLQQMARCGKIPGIRLGKYWRFRKSEIDQWLRADVNYVGYAYRQNEEVKP